MNFDQIIKCLENDEKRKEFILRLKSAGETSSPSLHLQKAMTELNMHRAPKGIFETTTMQHMMQFSTTEDCLQNFRLVCKSWKNAVETIRFDRTPDAREFEILDNALTRNPNLSTAYFEKYLPVFQKLTIPLRIENKFSIFSLILQNTKKLKEIGFILLDDIWCADYDSFIFQMLKKSHLTLCKLATEKLVFSDVIFPNMRELTIYIGQCENMNYLLNFKDNFSKVVNTMENLVCVELNLFGEHRDFCDYIAETFQKHCISAAYADYFLDVLPAKIIEYAGLEDNIENKKYNSQVQYIHVHVSDRKDPMAQGWDRYKTIFDQCTNLREIELEYFPSHSTSSSFMDIIPTLSESSQQTWNERFNYFKSRGIRLVKKGEIYENEDLRNKLAKEAGITWRFHFD